MQSPKSMPRTIPKASGVYLFKDAHDVIIYIGKAKSLYNRILSYFQRYRLDWKIKALLDEYATIDCIITHTEIEALLLEAELIQKHKPKFNSLLKEGNPFVYIYFSNDPLPILSIARHKKKKGIYFGPFLHKTQARKVVAFLQRTFALNRCNKVIAHGCLEYHIGNCAGSCRPDFSAEDFLFRVSLAKNVLTNNRDAFIKEIEHKIKEYNQALAFEKARNAHRYLENIQIIFDTLQAEFSLEKYADQIVASVTPKTYIAQMAEDIAQQLQIFFKSVAPIHTIDCFDISHFQSKEIVGSCIRFLDGIPDKNKFRRFKIKTLAVQNDYAALQEIITRRYKNKDELPDLVLIDGGKGQLSAARAVLSDAFVVSLAKKEERIFGMPQHPDGLVLNQKDPIALLLIGLRDYAHHFAISYHRLLRKKSLKDM